MNLPRSVPSWIVEILENFEFTASQKVQAMTPTPEYACGFHAAAKMLIGAFEEQVSKDVEKKREWLTIVADARAKEIDVA